MRYTSIFFSFPFGMFFACFKYVHKWTMKQPKEHVTFRFRTAFGNQWLISSRNGVYKWLSFNILPTKTETIVPINIPDTQRPLLLDIYVYEVSSKKQHKFDFFFSIPQFKHLAKVAHCQREDFQTDPLAKLMSRECKLWLFAMKHLTFHWITCLHIWWRTHSNFLTPIVCDFKMSITFMNSKTKFNLSKSSRSIFLTTATLTTGGWNVENESGQPETGIAGSGQRVIVQLSIINGKGVGRKSSGH